MKPFPGISQLWLRPLLITCRSQLRSSRLIPSGAEALPTITGIRRFFLSGTMQ
jgi:hypothetical protein